MFVKCSAAPRIGGRALVLAAAIIVPFGAGGAEAADECQISFVYMQGSGQSAVPMVAQEKASANAIETINRSAVRYVINDRDWPVDVEIAIVGGPIKWVALTKKGARDPQSGNYVGSVDLKRMKCLPGGTAGSGGGGSGGAKPLSPPQAIVDKLFAPFKAIVVPHANQFGPWLTEAIEVAKREAAYYGGCPSPAAQSQYDRLKTRRQQTVEAREMAQSAMEQAARALQDCRNSTGNSPLCGASYTTLPFAGQYAAAESLVKALDASITAMRSLRCVSGCGQTARISVPTASIKPGGTVSQQLVINDVCTQWDRGGFGVNPTAILSGNTAQMANIEPPHCAARENIPVCTRWNISLLLPRLRDLRLVPPEVQIGNIDLQVPMRSLRIVNGVSPTACSTPLRICRPNGILEVNQGQNAFTVTAGGSCTDFITVGCQEPPFGLQPTYATVQVPDLARATVRLVGGRFTPPQFSIDLSRPEFQAACGGSDITLPLPPTIQLSSQTVDLPFLCTRPTWVNLVSNP
jgi:hypothetical protein